MELTVVMPCLNEAETVATCVRKAIGFLAESGISGEVLVADNGSTDGSQRLAADAGARVVPISDKGYGNALMGGIIAANGKYVIMGDADDSYDFTNLMPFVNELRKGADLVMGNRFRGGIAPGAMPPLHKYLGNPVLSFIGRLFFRSKAGDFHCGLRGFNRDSVMALNLQATGMEFASEMVVKATLAGQRRDRGADHLVQGRPQPGRRTCAPGGTAGGTCGSCSCSARAGCSSCPAWPCSSRAWSSALLVIPHPFSIGSVTFDVDTLVAASAMVVIGFQSVLFWLFTQVYAGSEGFLPEEPKVQRVLEKLSLERGLMLGGLIGLAGLAGLIFSLLYWNGVKFSHLNYEHSLRLMIPSVTALIVSCQVVLGTFFLSILGIKHTRHPVTAASAPIVGRVG